MDHTPLAVVGLEVSGVWVLGDAAVPSGSVSGPGPEVPIRLTPTLLRAAVREEAGMFRMSAVVPGPGVLSFLPLRGIPSEYRGGLSSTSAQGLPAQLPVQGGWPLCVPVPTTSCRAPVLPERTLGWASSQRALSSPPSQGVQPTPCPSSAATTCGCRVFSSALLFGSQ